MSSNAEKCRKWREKIARDPDLATAQKEKDKARVQRNRAKPKTTEERERLRELNRIRVQRCLAKKKATMNDSATAMNSVPKSKSKNTKQNSANQSHKRELCRLRVQKHRANQHPQKKQQERDKRKQYYYKKKDETSRESTQMAAKERHLQDKATQTAEEYLKANGYPYPNKEAFKGAARRVKAKFSNRN